MFSSFVLSIFPLWCHIITKLDPCCPEIKNYPFSKMKLVVESRNWEYTVDLAVDENGELQAVSLEKEKNYNPFLK